MSKKYQVSQNGQFLGHHSAHTPNEAVAKAIASYGDFYDIDHAVPFDVTRGNEHYSILGE